MTVLDRVAPFSLRCQLVTGTAFISSKLQLPNFAFFMVNLSVDTFPKLLLHLDGPY